MIMTDSLRSLDRSLPNSSEAEQGVIAAIILTPDLIHQAIGRIAPPDFYHPTYRRVYQAMLNLFDASKPIDPILIGEELKKEGSLDGIGGVSAITNITLGVPFHTDIKVYVDVIMEQSQARRLVKICNLTSDEIMSGDVNLAEVLDQHDQLVYQLRRKDSAARFHPIGELTHESFLRLKEYHEHPTSGLLGVTTGFKDLDSRTAGLEKGDLIIVAARPSMGKTALTLRMAYRASQAPGAVVAFFSLEMSKEQLTQRVVATEAGIDLMRLRKAQLSRDEWNKFTFVAEQIEKSGLVIDDTPSLSVMEIKSRCRQLLTEKKRIDAVYIDHLGLVGHGDHGRSRHLQLSDMTKALKGMAKDLGIPVIALHQLSRKCEERPNKRPLLSDLRDSGSIEEDADVVMFIYRHNYYFPDDVESDNLAEIIFGKIRNGPTGTDKLTFIKHATRFEDYAH